MIKNLVVIWLFQLVLLISYVQGQEHRYPQVGENMTSFTLKTNKGTMVDKLSPSQLKGQYYILDFWNIGCVSCVASFPKMDSIQTEFSSRLKIILVGLEDRRRDISKYYEVYRNKYNLHLTSVFDSVSFRQLVPRGVPHLIWVNDEGIVKAITNSEDVTRSNIIKFLNNQSFDFNDVSFKASKDISKFNPKKTLLISGNGGSDTGYVFRTIFALWNSKMGEENFPSPLHPFSKDGKILYQVSGAPVDILYKLAYFGTLTVTKDMANTYPIPQISDKANLLINSQFGQNPKFGYSVEIRNKNFSQKSLMMKMRADLACFFGLHAQFVDQKVPCYKMVVIDSNLFLKARSFIGVPSASWHAEDKIHKFLNMPINRIVEILPSKLIPFQSIYISNETNYSGMLSFNLDAKINELESIRLALNKVGIDLIPSHKEMQVLKITEGHF